jgi:hypothetical protein
MEAHKHLIDWAITNGYVVQVEVEDELEYEGHDYKLAVEASEAGDIGCIVLGKRGYIPGNKGYSEYNFEYAAHFAFVHEYTQEPDEIIYDYSDNKVAREWSEEYAELMEGDDD